MISPTMAVAAIVPALSDQAGFAREARLARFRALVIDVIVFGFISFVVNSVYGVTEVTSGFITASGGMYSTTTAVAWPWLTLVGILYFTVPEAMFGATPGKYWMRLKVVRLDGTPLGVGSVIVRNLLKPMDFLPLLYLLGGVLVFVTRGSQRLGDIAAGTTVVSQHRALDPGATRTSGRTARRWLAIALAGAALFTIGFDYFGRPPLVIQGLFNERLGFGQDVVSYSLGHPTWGLGHVTYPMTLHTAIATCSGEITLTWSVIGWNESANNYSCIS